MAKKLEKWCVYACTLEDAIGRDMACGDGITASSSRLYAVCDSRAEAEAEMERLNGTRHMTRLRMPGDGRLWPVLEVGPFDPLDFTGRQNRDEYHGLRLKQLWTRLLEEAARCRASME